MSPRHAIYYVPPEASPLRTFGEAWLGRDAATGAAIPVADLTGLASARHAEITAAPRLYGFHATLKPPFRLAGGTTEAELRAALAAFAAPRRPFTLPPLALAAIGRFLALVPSAPCPEIDALAAECVRGFDRFRAPPETEELARRRAAGLSAAEERLLEAWGYPYVMEAYRFHLTLTGPLETGERDLVRPVLARLLRRVETGSVVVDSVSLFRQAAPGQPFLHTDRFAFAGGP